MSIHHSKGLEFPVVFVAGLGRKFNLADRSGRMVFERDAGIGLRVVDPERMIEYPSAAHLRVISSIEQHTRAEEMRVLYVAMTRAREKLILLGSVDGLDRVANAPATERKEHLLSLQITSAITPLDWLVPALTVRHPESDPVAGHLSEVHVHMPEQIVRWRLDRHAGGGGRSLGRTVAGGLHLPENEPRCPNDPRVEEVLDRVDYVYPSLALASVRAVVAAGEFKGDCDYQRDPEQRKDAREDGETFTVPPSKYLGEGPSSGAIRRGIITHRVLQHLDFQAARDSDGVASELQRMRAEGVASADEMSLVDQGTLVWFVTTPLAEVIRTAGERYRREFPFVAAEAPEFFDPLVRSPGDDTVLVRGIVDGIVPVEGGIEIIDFKTDAVGERDVADRSKRYRPQMTMYARAMERIWRTEVRAQRLVFLAARQIVTLGDVG